MRKKKRKENGYFGREGIGWQQPERMASFKENWNLILLSNDMCFVSDNDLLLLYPVLDLSELRFAFWNQL